MVSAAPQTTRWPDTRPTTACLFCVFPLDVQVDVLSLLVIPLDVGVDVVATLPVFLLTVCGQCCGDDRAAAATAAAASGRAVLTCVALGSFSDAGTSSAIAEAKAAKV